MQEYRTALKEHDTFIYRSNRISADRSILTSYDTNNGGSRQPKEIVKVWSMVLAVMMVAAKVEVAAAAAAAAAAGMLATILVLLVASSPFTCLLQQF